mgnify:CR=1 FL=1
MRYITLIGFLFVLAGCQLVTVSSEEFTNSWTGKNINDFIFEVGSPSNKTVLSDGRQIFVYNHQRFVDGISYYCSGNIFVSKNDEILKIEFDGNIGGCNRLKNQMKNR